MTMALGKLLAGARRQSMAAADARVKLISEVVTGGRLFEVLLLCVCVCHPPLIMYPVL